MTIKQIASMMNVTEADAIGFLAGLKIWIDKGFSFEQAIERHMAQMTRFAENATEMAADQMAVKMLADGVWDAANA